MQDTGDSSRKRKRPLVELTQAACGYDGLHRLSNGSALLCLAVGGHAVALTGELELAVLRGRVHVHGAVRHPGMPPLQIHSLYCASAIVLEAQAGGTDQGKTAANSGSLSEEVLAAVVAFCQARRIAATPDCLAVAVIRELFSVTRRSLEPYRGWASLFPPRDPDAPCPTARIQMLGDSHLVFSEEWRASVRRAVDLFAPLTSKDFLASKALPSVMVCGGKDTGKSTFASHLVNTLLNVHTKVAYMECDMGQPQFTPSGMVSLHILDEHMVGPGFCHLQMPRMACFTGADTPKYDPSSYLDALFTIFDSYM